MATFSEHIGQAERNLSFLCGTNSMNPVYWDWQVTIAYYVAVHFMNAHLAHVVNSHFRSHEAVKHAINPYANQPGKVPEEIYTSYGRLEGLSKRSRYLCHQDPANRDNSNHITIPKHFARAIKSLEKILNYFCKLYGISISPPPEIFCDELTKQSQLNIFILKASPLSESSRRA